MMFRASVAVWLLLCWFYNHQFQTAIGVTDFTATRVSNDCIATTKTNDFLGYLAHTYDNTTQFCSFLGIKYGTAKRYKEAEIYASRIKEVTAQKDGSACVQNHGNQTIGTEDCLFLSVHTPQINGSLPVLVFIHGGGYAFGTSALTSQRPDFFMETKQVVMVFIQYRLGALGFVDFNSDNFPANLGLKDQTLALKWVKENIGYFGGDSERVTIQGESAGASSVSLHLYSPLSKGLFRAGISESGSACSPWSAVPKAWARQRLRQLAAVVLCPLDDIPTQLIQPADKTARCLLEKPAQELVRAAGTFSMASGMNSFMPVIERVSFTRPFLTEIPWSGPKDQVPWISGVNSNEAGLLINAIGQNIRGQFYVNLSHALYLEYTTPETDSITHLIQQHYGFSNPVTSSHRSAASKALTEGMFTFPNYQCHRLHSGSNSYNYYFNYVSSAQRSRPLKGVFHGEDLQYFFIRGQQNIRLTGSKQDIDMSNKLVNLWLDFVKSPNTPPIIQHSTEEYWLKYDPSANNVLAIDETGFNMVTDPNLQENWFWQILPFRELMP